MCEIIIIVLLHNAISTFVECACSGMGRHEPFLAYVANVVVII